MEISTESLREQYEKKETEELVELRRRGALTDMASRVLYDILRERGIKSEIRDQIGNCHGSPQWRHPRSA